MKIIAHANSSKAWPYRRTKDETKTPIDQPTIIKLKKKKIKKKPSSNKWKSKKKISNKYRGSKTYNCSN